VLSVENADDRRLLDEAQQHAANGGASALATASDWLPAGHAAREAAVASALTAFVDAPSPEALEALLTAFDRLRRRALPDREAPRLPGDGPVGGGKRADMPSRRDPRRDGRHPHRRRPARLGRGTAPAGGLRRDLPRLRRTCPAPRSRRPRSWRGTAIPGAPPRTSRPARPFEVRSDAAAESVHRVSALQRGGNGGSKSSVKDAVSPPPATLRLPRRAIITQRFPHRTTPEAIYFFCAGHRGRCGGDARRDDVGLPWAELSQSAPSPSGWWSQGHCAHRRGRPHGRGSPPRDRV
jgi:hypothetical protein